MSKVSIELDGELVISGTFEKGEKERGPTYDCGGTPGYPDQWVDVGLTINGMSVDLDENSKLYDWCVEKLEACYDEED
jgi:hypothetical protein